MNGPQVSFFGLDGVDPAALLQPGQHLGDHQRRQAAEADLAAAADRRLGPPPVALRPGRVGFPGGAQPMLVGIAVAAVGIAALAGAGGDRARAAGSQRARHRVNQQVLDADAQRLPQVRRGAAQRRRGRHLLACAAFYRAGTRSAHREAAGAVGSATWLIAQTLFGEPTPAGDADTGAAAARWSSSPLPGRPAGPAADAQPEATAPGAPGPSPPRRGTPGRSPPRSPLPAGRPSRRRTRAIPAVPAPHRGQRHRAHRAVPVSPRGLGTRSTASRSRAGSGCR